MSAIFPYNFAPRGASRMDLDQFLAVAALQFPEYETTAIWELERQRMPQYVEFNNFRFVIPLNKDIREAGMDLCGKLIAFAVRFLEKLAELHRVNFGEVPSAEQIIEDLDCLAQQQDRNYKHEIWMYVESLRHPVVELAVTNALNDRWNNDHLEVTAFSAFYPQGAEQLVHDKYSVSYGTDDSEVEVPVPAVTRPRRSARR